MESIEPRKKFDFVLCRNVLIYHDKEHKRHVISRLVSCLNKGGYLMTGHSESLMGIYDALKVIEPSIYQKIK